MDKPKFSVVIRSDAYQKLINNTLGDKEIARDFVANITTAVSNNPALQNCEASSIISAGLMAQSLKLSLSNSLGYCYLIPYGNKAQFQLGYKGFLQLARRSGQYKKINVLPIHEGEYKGRDKFGEDTFDFSHGHEFDDKPIIGYYAYFVLENGGEQGLYWTKEQCEKHGRKYSKAYSKLWTTDFDTMAQKTVLKQLISKWGVMSIDLQRAVQSDQAVIKEDGSFDYVDRVGNEETSIEIPEIPEDDALNINNK